MRTTTLIIVVCTTRAASPASAGEIVFSVANTITQEPTGYVYDAEAGDLDGDGDLDIVASRPQNLVWWDNVNGDGSTWAAVLVDGASQQNFRTKVVAVDIDGDGNPDVLAAGDIVDTIAWWANVSGNGLSWTAHTIDDDVADPVAVYAADLDGGLDVLGASPTEDEVARSSRMKWRPG